jgi:phosphoribosylanthranilate isomerase
MTAPGPRVKLCGFTVAAEAAHAAAAGVDFLGLSFWPRSRRAVDPATARDLAAAARAAGSAQIVGVFVNAAVAEIAATAARVRLDVVQLHGDEPPELVAEVRRATGLPVWKAVAVASAADVAELARWGADAILLDAPSAGRGGSGVAFDWAHARAAVIGHPGLAIILAGGLRPGTIAAAIAAVAPWAVDAASGVERAPGQKDPDAVAAFVAAARGAG